jgi:hypothetical protein
MRCMARCEVVISFLSRLDIFLLEEFPVPLRSRVSVEETPLCPVGKVPISHLQSNHSLPQQSMSLLSNQVTFESSAFLRGVMRQIRSLKNP